MEQGKSGIDILREKYPEGTRVVLDKMGVDPRPIEQGEKGTVVCVDDIGTVHVDWDCGRRLGLIPGTDTFHVIGG